MLRGANRDSGLRLSEILCAHPALAKLVSQEVFPWLTDALHDTQSEVSIFLRENGFSSAFTCINMVYRGEPFPSLPLPFCPYSDGEYSAVQGLISRSFYDLRRAVGIDPNYIAPTSETRREFADNIGDLFTLRQNGKIIAFVTAIGNEVDNVCVDDAHRGQGLGAALTMHATNHILGNGHREATLGVVDRNTLAHALYRKLGFIDHYTTYLYAL